MPISVILFHVQSIELYFATSRLQSIIFSTYFMLCMSRSDLFHMSLCLSPPPPGVAYYPWCIYPCVSCLSVPVHLVCFSKSTSVFPVLLLFAILLFLVLLVSTLVCPDSQPACLTTLPVLTTEWQLVVKAGRMVRQAGTESRNRQGSKPGGLEKGEREKHAG